MEKLNEIIEKANYCLNCKTKPCTTGCPLGNNIPDFIDCIKKGDYRKAYQILNETTVLQSICGRICPHNKQCQGKCVRGIKNDPVSIGELEAFIGDMAIKENWGIDKEKNMDNEIRQERITKNVEVENTNADKKIAVIGSGPAGLTCATFLAKKGYKVTIYEKHDKMGGLLRYGIPDFRLDRDVLDKQISRILDLGIEVIYEKKLGKDYNLEYLKKNYDAVFLAFGANISRKMNILGESLKGVFGGNELLESREHPNYNGKKVAVIGGGNVAMDVSRTIKRLGAERVYVVYRRAEEQMPAERKEIEDAKKEGVEFLFQHDVIKVKSKEDFDKNKDADNLSGQAVGSIECVKTKLIHKDGDDRLVPVDIEGSNFNVDVDYVVMAVGAEAESGLLNQLGVRLNKWGYIDVDENFMTSVPNVFAGGDLAGTKATVAWAARNGRDAADAICSIIK